MLWLAPASAKALAQKVLDFLWTFRNSIYLEIILVTQGTIWNLQLKTKATEVLIYGITNINIKQKQYLDINSYLLYWTGKIMNINKKIIGLATCWITYFSLSFMYS